MSRDDVTTAFRAGQVPRGESVSVGVREATREVCLLVWGPDSDRRPLAYVALDPDEARSLAAMLVRSADETEGLTR